MASPPVPEGLATALDAARRGDLAVLHAMIDWTLSEAPIVATPQEGVPGRYVSGLDNGIAEITRRAGSWRQAAEELLPVAERLATARLARPATPAERDTVLPLVQIAPLRAEATPAQRAFFDPLRERASRIRDVWIVETSNGNLPVLLIPDGELIVLPFDSDAYRW